jgi:hypothetical protein
MNKLFLSTKDLIQLHSSYPIKDQVVTKTYEDIANETFNYLENKNQYLYLAGILNPPIFDHKVVTEQYEFFQAIDFYLHKNKHIDELHIFAHGWEHGIYLIKDDCNANVIVQAFDFEQWPNSFRGRINKIKIWANRCGRKIKKDRECFAQNLAYILGTEVEASDNNIELVFEKDYFIFKGNFNIYKGE